MKKLFMRLVWPVAFALSLGGCGVADLWDNPIPEEKKAVTVLMVGGTENQPADLGPLTTVVPAAVAAGREIVIIRPSDPPEVTAHIRPGPDIDRAANAEYRTKVVATYTAAVFKMLQDTSATTGEHASYDAIVLGDRFLANPQDEMWALDSMLSTAGMIRFQDDGLIDAEPADILPQLSDSLGRLKPNKIHLVGAGDVAPPQETLSPAEKRNVIEIATRSLTEAGATVDLVSEPRAGPGREGPPVTPVPVQAPVIDVPAKAGPIEVPVNSAEFFAPDSDVLLDPEAAARMVAPFAAWAAQDPFGKLEIHGLTARGLDPDPDKQHRLGMARALRIQGLLVAAGVDQARIDCFGEGSYSPWFISENDPATGAWDRKRQALNRKIVIRAVPGAGRE